jgi:hypothetical protein
MIAQNASMSISVAISPRRPDAGSDISSWSCRRKHHSGDASRVEDRHAALPSARYALSLVASRRRSIRGDQRCRRAVVAALAGVVKQFAGAVELVAVDGQVLGGGEEVVAPRGISEAACMSSRVWARSPAVVARDVGGL